MAGTSTTTRRPSKPLGEAKTNIDMANMLAKAMGYTDACFDDGIPEMAKALIEGKDGANAIYGADMTYENLKKEHWRKLPDFVPYADDLKKGLRHPFGQDRILLLAPERPWLASRRRVHSLSRKQGRHARLGNTVSAELPYSDLGKIYADPTGTTSAR